MGWFSEFIEGVKEFALDVGQANLDAQSHRQQHTLSEPAPTHTPATRHAEEPQRAVRDLPEASLSAARQTGQDIQQSANRPAETAAPAAQAAKTQTSQIRR